MNDRTIVALRSCILVTVLSFGICINAAEFSDSDVIPEVTSIVFTQDAVALTLEPFFSGGQVGVTDRTKFFVADREDYLFRQVSDEDFAALLDNDHYQDQMNPYAAGNFNVVHSGICQRARDGTSSVEKRIAIKETVFSVRMACRSSIADALRIDDDIWVATFQMGDHGAYGAEGLVIADIDGINQHQIDIGGSAASGIARDPWSRNTWVITYSRITVVSDDHMVVNRYWPIHKFDDCSGQPDVFVVAAMERQLTHPFAILAYGLGEKSYSALHAAIKTRADSGPEDLLYRFHMWGDRDSYDPQLPGELNSLVEVAEPTIFWRRFVCMLDSDRAEELCNLPFDEWPGEAR